MPIEAERVPDGTKAADFLNPCALWVGKSSPWVQKYVMLPFYEQSIVLLADCSSLHAPNKATSLISL